MAAFTGFLYCYLHLASSDSQSLYSQLLTIYLIKMHPGHHGNSMRGYKWISRKAFSQTEKKNIQSLCHDKWIRCIIFWLKNIISAPCKLNECWRIWPVYHIVWWNIRKHQILGPKYYSKGQGSLPPVMYDLFMFSHNLHHFFFWNSLISIVLHL